VLDTVDFGVVRLSVGGDIVYENDAVGRFSSAIPGLHAASARTDLLLEDGVTPLDPSDHPLARVRRATRSRTRSCGRGMPRAGSVR
jgi:hypothetical protein